MLYQLFCQFTPQRAKHDGPVSQLTKHYVKHTKQQYVKINTILHYEEEFLKTRNPVKIFAEWKKTRATHVTINVTNKDTATNTSS